MIYGGAYINYLVSVFLAKLLEMLGNVVLTYYIKLVYFLVKSHIILPFFNCDLAHNMKIMVKIFLS